MSSLAKLYGDPSFDDFWAARSIFVNKGDQIIRNYRVRYRVDGFSNWSGWKKSKVVYPGQTVVEPFFPVLDLDKLAGMSGARPAMIEVEYEYSSNGEKVRETDSIRTQLTSRNQVVFSSRKMDQILTWYEANDYAPFIMTAFSSSNDPVMQQVAGAVSKMSDGVAAVRSDKEAIAFLSAMWDFCELNQIAYHSPPGWSINGQFGQHIKYGRDVIRNRAGTCVDLAILWASVAKAGGLESHIALVRGHAFPVIKLPSGTPLPIESTAINKATFEQAVEIASKNFRQPENGWIITVDICENERNGVHCLDLPQVEPDYLTKLGYTTTRPNVQQTEQVTHDAMTETHHTSTNDPQVNNPRRQALVGDWICRVENAGAAGVFAVRMQADGGYAMASRIVSNGYTQDDQETGTWAELNGRIKIETENGRFIHPYYWDGDILYVSIDGNDYAFQRAQF